MSKQTDLAYHYIKERIYNGTFKPSQKLIESQLAESVGVSRNTIKKALLKLEQDHLVEIEDNKGATIKSYSLEEILHNLEILEVLEGLVVISAMKNITEAQLSRMEQLVIKMEEIMLQNRYDEYTDLTGEFRDIYYDAAINKQAVELITAIRNPLKRYQLRTVLFPGTKESSIKQHRKVYEAIKNKDEEAAENAIRADLRIVRETYTQNYKFLF